MNKAEKTEHISLRVSEATKKVPSYVLVGSLGNPFINLPFWKGNRPFLLWLVRQENVARPRIVGLFTSKADAEVYIAWATHFEQSAADEHGNRGV